MPANLFPLFLKLEGRQCLVVGAGNIASSKITALLDAGAKVIVVAPHASNNLQQLAAGGKFRWIAREFQANDLEGMFLVIAAASDSAINRAVFLEARERGILCNAVDDPAYCDFYFPAVVRRGDLQIAISTSGQSPALAQRLRRELEEAFDDSIGDWVRFVGELRREIIATHPPSEERKRLLLELAYSERPGLKRREARVLSLDSGRLAPREAKS